MSGSRALRCITKEVRAGDQQADSPSIDLPTTNSWFYLALPAAEETITLRMTASLGHVVGVPCRSARGMSSILSRPIATLQCGFPEETMASALLTGMDARRSMRTCARSSNRAIAQIRNLFDSSCLRAAGKRGPEISLGSARTAGFCAYLLRPFRSYWVQHVNKRPKVTPPPLSRSIA